MITALGMPIAESHCSTCHVTMTPLVCDCCLKPVCARCAIEDNEGNLYCGDCEACLPEDAVVSARSVAKAAGKAPGTGGQ